MAIGDSLWEDMHNYVSFLLDQESVEDILKTLVFPNSVTQSQVPIMVATSLLEGNLGNILKAILIEILVKTRVMEHIQIGT